jgi:HprK-related kinase A
MNLGELSAAALRQRLCAEGLLLRTGPFVFRLHSDHAHVAAGLRLLYAAYPLAEPGYCADFTVHISHSRGLRRWWRPQARFFHDGQSPFEPLRADHAFPLMEWAMNWCIAVQSHEHLLLHAAVVEREGLAAILPAPPGSGKSTLCAALIHRGWRLLSDEMTIIRLRDGQLLPLVRPVSLKNQSIALMQAFVPGLVVNEVSHETIKGSVTHARAPDEHVRRMSEPAQARWVVFPRYVAGAPPTLQPRSRAASLLELGRNAFNYAVLGEAGFHALADVVQGSDCYDFQYSRLDDAVAVFDRLLQDTRPLRTSERVPADAVSPGART